MALTNYLKLNLLNKQDTALMDMLRTNAHYIQLVLATCVILKLRKWLIIHDSYRRSGKI